jgi:hypothetical protein
MNEEFIKYIELAINDGVLSETNRLLLTKKAQQLGIDDIEAELFLEKHLFNQAKKSSDAVTDDYDITDDELVIRLSNYSSKLKDYKAIIQLDPFPERLSEKGKVGNALNSGRKALASLTKSDLLTDSLQLAGKYSPVPGGKFVGKIAGNGLSNIVNKIAGTENKELKHTEIIELCKKYMLILEKRKNKSEFLLGKHTEFDDKIRSAELSPPKRKFF